MCATFSLSLSKVQAQRRNPIQLYWRHKTEKHWKTPIKNSHVDRRLRFKTSRFLLEPSQPLNVRTLYAYIYIYIHAVAVIPLVCFLESENSNESLFSDAQIQWYVESPILFFFLFINGVAKNPFGALGDARRSPVIPCRVHLHVHIRLRHRRIRYGFKWVLYSPEIGMCSA